MSDWDVVIVGRSYAALSAALMLGRTRMSVLVIGDAPPRNEAARHAHGLLASDHTPPAELIARAEDDLDRYPTVLLERGHVGDIAGGAGEFTVTFEHRSTTASTVVLATGVNDDIPAVPGLADLWGNGVYTCPFCDGYEHSDQHWGLIGDKVEVHQPILLRTTWASSVTVFTLDPDGKLRRALGDLSLDELTVETERVKRLHRAGDDGLVAELADGREVALGAMFVAPAFTPNDQLARALGCDLVDGFVQVDMMGNTSVDGVLAIGDLTRPGPHQITLAAADGCRAALAITMRLVEEQLKGMP